MTTIVHSTQMLEAEVLGEDREERFLRAIRAPAVSQNVSSSGSQSSIQRPAARSVVTARVATVVMRPEGAAARP